VFEKAIEVLQNKEMYDAILKPIPENIPPVEEIKEKLKDRYS
jgi:carboxyl-terminal processing protease